MNGSPRSATPLVVMLFALTCETRPTRLAAQQAPAADFQAFSRFDFVPGEKVAGFEDFSQDSIGDFPAKWNTNAAGEVVTVAGKPGRWLKLTRAGTFIPELAPTLPDNFTLEFDLLVPPAFNAGYGPTWQTSMTARQNETQTATGASDTKSPWKSLAVGAPDTRNKLVAEGGPGQ